MVLVVGQNTRLIYGPGAHFLVELVLDGILRLGTDEVRGERPRDVSGVPGVPHISGHRFFGTRGVAAELQRDEVVQGYGDRVTSPMVSTFPPRGSAL